MIKLIGSNCQIKTKSWHHKGSNPIQLSSTGAAAMKPWGEGTNVSLPGGGLPHCPSPTVGCSTCPDGTPAPPLENWVRFGPQLASWMSRLWLQPLFLAPVKSQDSCGHSVPQFLHWPPVLQICTQPWLPSTWPFQCKSMLRLCRPNNTVLQTPIPRSSRQFSTTSTPQFTKAVSYTYYY